jgi:hypothetical protein
MRPNHWSAEDDAELQRLVDIGAKIPAIARDLRRTQAGVTMRMATLGISRRAGVRTLTKTALAHIEAVERRLKKAAGRAVREKRGDR